MRRFIPATIILLLLTASAFGQDTPKRKEWLWGLIKEHPNSYKTRLECEKLKKEIEQRDFISRVIDGDTLELKSGERVRLIGIDTPETYITNKLYKDAERTGRDIEVIRARGKEATLFVRELAQGKEARLEFDIERHDRYGRTLAYVFITGPEDEIFLNAEIVRQGYASIMTYPPNVKYTALFEKLYQEAVNNNRGLWK